MSRAILLPSAVDALRAVNDNAIDNFLAAKPGYLDFMPAYDRAYMLVHRTGVVVVDTDIAIGTDEVTPEQVSIIKDPRVRT